MHAGCTPTLMELTCFPLPNEPHPVDLTERIGTLYRKFGIQILEDKGGECMSAIENECMRNAEDINFQVLKLWLRGKGREPVTWDTLVSVLQDIGLQKLARDIKSTLI